jgi:hypothetical protein
MGPDHAGKGALVGDGQGRIAQGNGLGDQLFRVEAPVRKLKLLRQ